MPVSSFHQLSALFYIYVESLYDIMGGKKEGGKRPERGFTGGWGKGGGGFFLDQ